MLTNSKIIKKNDLVISIFCNNNFYMCLECDKEFENKLNVAICPECLKAEKEKYERGIPSKYKTVNIYLQERCKT